MHYRNGREAKNGDKVVFIRQDAPVIGILYGAVPGNNDCNGRIATCGPSDTYADLKNCIHFDDVNAAVDKITDSTKPQSA